MSDRKVHLRYQNSKIACGRANHYGIAGAGGAAFSITTKDMGDGAMGGRITCIKCLQKHPDVNKKYARVRCPKCGGLMSHDEFENLGVCVECEVA